MILYIGNPEEKLLDLINKFIKAARYKNHAKFVSISILLQFKSIHCCCCVALVVSDSVQPHRRQPTRLPCPWDSPGKNTGVGCHFLLQCMKVKSQSEVIQSCPTLATPWTAAFQAPLSMGFYRQKYWNGVQLPSPLSLVQRCTIFRYFRISVFLFCLNPTMRQLHYFW